MKVLDLIIIIFGPVVTAANTIGPFVFGIWLIVLGHWVLVVIGLLAYIAFSIVLKYLLMVQVLLSAPIPSLARKGAKSRMLFLIFLSQSYAAIVMIAWCLLALLFSLEILQTKQVALIPLLGWSYGVALAPWTYLVMHEMKASNAAPPSFMLVFFACLGYFTMATIIVLRGDLIYAISAFLVLVLMGLAAQYLLSVNLIGKLHTK